ncbi:MAG: hypothetical protein U1F65_01025 [Verrucomicrobiota bacterium]
MSLLFLTRKFACRAALAMAAVASAQAGFAPSGGEYPVIGLLPASQSRPQADINAGGGYVVWQDQNMFGNRSTVMGRPLNSGLNATLPAFRVNSSAVGDHEKPAVVLLKDGGAAFVWQGGQFSFQHIYARFLSASNTWLGLDQLVNSSTKNYQADPALTVLANGNVVVVYSTHNPTTLQDVFGQVFSPAGAKIGTEFQISQFTARNQRSAAIAPLTNGGFVVAWVSEQQRVVEGESAVAIPTNQIARPSVDVFARLFNADGTPANNEFVVNDGFDVCAQPAVAAGDDGSVVISWSSLDTEIRKNGWDIKARSFTFAGGIPQAGAQARINTVLYGDQFSPQISVAGNSYLAVWTSIGQDGSREGVYGRYLNADGSVDGAEFRVNTTTAGVQQQPAVAADSSGRFLTVWTSPTFGPSKYDLFAQVYTSSSYVALPLAENFGSPKFVGQATAPVKTTTVGIHDPALEPPTIGYPGGAVVAGAPETNGFALAAGTYNGLFYSLNGISLASAGGFKATVDGKKNYTAKFTFAKGSYSVSGKLDDQGNSGTKIISRKSAGLPSLTVSFQVDLSGADLIVGTVQCGGDWNSVINADRQVYSKTQPTLLGGNNYTLTIPAIAKGPGGTSFGTVSNAADGLVVFNGTLADGNKIAQKGYISKNGVWPLFAPVSGGGLVISWIDYNATTPGGELAWIKPAIKGSGLYTKGFTNGVTSVLSPCSAVVAGPRVLKLSGGGLSDALSFDIALDAGGKAATNGVTLAVTPGTGKFTGKVPNPTAGKPALSVSGVLTSGGPGEGFFSGSTESGQVTLQQP